MPPPSRIPPLLQPYTQLPADQGSLVLLTGVLGASTNWLVIRYICGALAKPDPGETSGQEDGVENEDVAVILVSWLRDWEFWKTEGRRAGGLDLARLTQQHRFAFIDGLSSLFLPDEITAPASAPPAAAPQATAPSSALPLRGPRTITPRGAPQAAVAAPPPPARAPTAQQHPPTFRLTSPMLSHLEDVVQHAQSHLSASAPKKTVLILDHPDLLLAASATDSFIPSPSPQSVSSAHTPITAIDLSTMLLRLRAAAHTAILTLAADMPLVAAAAPDVVAPISRVVPTALESAHAAFVVGQTHVADYVMSLRLLDTGYAADVSGVLRITRGSGGYEDEDEGEGGKQEHGVDVKADREVLYYVGGDGGVKVFERGAGGGGG